MAWFSANSANLLAWELELSGKSVNTSVVFALVSYTCTWDGLQYIFVFKEEGVSLSPYSPHGISHFSCQLPESGDMYFSLPFRLFLLLPSPTHSMNHALSVTNAMWGELCPNNRLKAGPRHIGRANNLENTHTHFSLETLLPAMSFGTFWVGKIQFALSEE